MKYLSNMDQTLLPFVLANNSTYDKKVVKKCGQSGLEKRQCTVQLTVFADEVPCHHFPGKGNSYKPIRETKIKLSSSQKLGAMKK